MKRLTQFNSPVSQTEYSVRVNNSRLLCGPAVSRWLWPRCTFDWAESPWFLLEWSPSPPSPLRSTDTQVWQVRRGSERKTISLIWHMAFAAAHLYEQDHCSPPQALCGASGLPHRTPRWSTCPSSLAVETKAQEEDFNSCCAVGYNINLIHMVLVIWIFSAQVNRGVSYYWE